MQNEHLAVRLDGAKKDLDSAIEKISAKYNLPCYLLELLGNDLVARLHNGAQKELEIARQTPKEDKAAE